MSSAPLNPLDVPPYQLQPLIAGITENIARPSSQSVQVRCAQALGTEIYVGCSNGELFRFAIEPQGSSTPESYTLLSRQSVVNDRPVQEITLLPSLSRALVLADHQVFIYTLPSLDMIPPTVIKPIRNVMTFAVDEQHLRRPLPADPSYPVEPIEFCVIKRNSIALYSLKDRLFFQKLKGASIRQAPGNDLGNYRDGEIPLPSGGSVAKRTGKAVCVADKESYNIVDLEAASMFPIMQVSQAQDGLTTKPSITVISENEFLIISRTGPTSLGVFVTSEGEPVRGTLQWPGHPEAVSVGELNVGRRTSRSHKREVPPGVDIAIIAMQPSRRALMAQPSQVQPPHTTRLHVKLRCILIILLPIPGEQLLSLRTGSPDDDAAPSYADIDLASSPVALDYPYITTLLPNDTIEIHNVETQAIAQVVPAPPLPIPGAPDSHTVDRKRLAACVSGFFIPSNQRSDKLRRVPVKLVRKTASRVPEDQTGNVDVHEQAGNIETGKKEPVDEEDIPPM